MINIINPFAGGKRANPYFQNDGPNDDLKKIDAYAKQLTSQIHELTASGCLSDYIFKFIENPKPYLVFQSCCVMGNHTVFPPSLDECACVTNKFNRFQNSRREAIEQRLITDATQDHPKQNALRYLSLGAGKCLQDFINLGKLIQVGYTQIEAVLVDPEFRGQLQAEREQTQEVIQQMALLAVIAKEKGTRLEISFVDHISKADGSFQIIQLMDFDDLDKAFSDVVKSYQLLAERGKFYLSYDDYDFTFSQRGCCYQQMHNLGSDKHASVLLLQLHQAGLPLTQENHHLLALNEEHAKQVSKAIELLQQDNVPFSKYFQIFLTSDTVYIRKFNYIIEKLHQNDIPLATESGLFLVGAIIKYAMMIDKSIEDLRKDGIQAPVVPPGSDEEHAEALFWGVVLLYKQNQDQSPIDYDLLTGGYCARVIGICRTIEYLDQIGQPLTSEVQEVLKKTATLGIFDKMQQMHKKGIPLLHEVRKFLCESIEARIGTLGKAMERLRFSLTLEMSEFLANNVRVSLMADFTIEVLYKENIALTAEIRAFLVEVNRVHALEVVSEALRFAEADFSFTMERLVAIYQSNGPLNYQIPGLSLKHLQKANILLTEKNFNALLRKGTNVLDILWTIVSLGEDGLLTQARFEDLMLDCVKL